MDASIRMLRILQIAMLVSIALYILVGERVGSVRQLSDPTIFYVLSMVTVTIVGVILVVRRTLVAHSAGILRDRPNDGTTLGRWRAGYVMTYALSEAIALFGLVLRIIGFSLSQIAPFYVAGFILLLFYGPRRPVSSVSS
jgi:hypothetical protein